MARIVKMAELLPEDIVFDFGGDRRYTVPGDAPLELILKIAQLHEKASNAEQIAGGDEAMAEAIGLEALQELDDQALYLLRMRDPELERSPFGVVGIQHFIAELLKQYGFIVAVEDGGEPDPRKPGAGGKRSRSSTGSRSSSKSSGSRRTTGATSP